MADCPSYAQGGTTFEFENGSVNYNGPQRAVQEVHPPGFDGKVVKHHGRVSRPFSISGRLVSASASDGSVLTRMVTAEGLMNTSVGTLTIPMGPAGTRSFSFVRFVDIRWGEMSGDATTGNVVVPYEAELEQIIFS